jgi:hypothetical protein
VTLPQRRNGILRSATPSSYWSVMRTRPNSRSTAGRRLMGTDGWCSPAARLASERNASQNRIVMRQTEMSIYECRLG